MGGELVGDDADLHIVTVGQAQMLLGRDVAEHRRAVAGDLGGPDRGGDVVVAGRDVGDERAERVEGRPVAPLLLEVDVVLDEVERHVARALDHDLDVVLPRAQGQLTKHPQLGELSGGMLSGLGHPRLRNALISMHDAPARTWSLEDLAAAAGMSRSAFATAFRNVVGTTPGQYLQGWRIALPQQALRAGKPMKIVAAEVGYGSEAALSRAFSSHAGLSPRAWKRAQTA